MDGDGFEKRTERGPKLSYNPVIAASDAEAARLREVLPEGVSIKIDRVGGPIDATSRIYPAGLADGVKEPRVSQLNSLEEPVLPPKSLNPENGGLDAEIEERARQARDAGSDPYQDI